MDHSCEVETQSETISETMLVNSRHKSGHTIFVTDQINVMKLNN